MEWLTYFLLRLFMSPEKAFLLQADLYEIYCSDLTEMGRWGAGLAYGGQLTLSLLPLMTCSLQRSMDMLLNYFKLTFRNIKRQRGYAFINIGGLAIGLAACLLIMLWVGTEWRVDRQHAGHERVFRLYSKRVLSDGTVDISPSLQLPLGRAIEDQFPQVELMVRMGHERTVLSVENRRFNLDGYYADPQFLEMLDFSLAQGGLTTALAAPNAIVLSSELAGRLFGDADPMGQIVTGGADISYQVTGVLAPEKGASHLNFDYLLPMATRTTDLEDWDNWMYWIYIKLERGADPAAFEREISDLISTRLEQPGVTLHLQKLTDVHLRDLSGGGLIETLKLLSVIALMILLIAMINFTNLSTAHSLKRAREIGLRKTVGAHRGALIRQFMGESCFYALFAFVGAQLIVLTLLPLFNQVTESQLQYGVFMSGWGFSAALAMALFTGLLAGIYPALFLSRFKIVSILKNASRTGSGGATGALRKGLVVLQFALSIALIVMVGIMDKQIGFIQRCDLGVNTEHVLCVPSFASDWMDKLPLLKSELKQNPRVLGVTATFMPPAMRAISTTGCEWTGKAPETKLQMDVFPVDAEYLDVLGLHMAQGRFFRPVANRTVHDEFVINESAARAMGMTDPVGQRFLWNDLEGTIVGVVRDFHFRPLQFEISPAFFTTQPWHYMVMIKYDGKDKEATLASIKKTYLSVFPSTVFHGSHLQDRIDRVYRSERRVHVLIRLGAGLAVLISCLGLLGLAAFSAEQRRKEVGIRRVMGAGFGRICWMMTRSFTQWVLAANLLAWPAAYLAARHWLNSYAYRVEMDWTLFAASGGIALLIAVLTVGHIAIQTARANPAHILRNE